MTSEAQIAANHANSLRSTGPRSAAGKSRSSMNARKHGRRSERVKRLREHSIAFEERRIKWSACSQPVGDLEEFLLHQNVSLSFELERARAAHFEHLQSLIENADEIEVAEINKLGDRLFTNRCGPQQLYGSTGTTARKEATASWNGEAVDPDKPADLVEKLTSSALGCCWVLTRFGRAAHSPGASRGILAITRQAENDQVARPPAP